MTATAFQASDCLILVVDDLPSNLRVVQGILAPAGYDLTLATGGSQALERVKAARPDLIVLDLMMPDLDGITVCKMLKADPQYAEIPIIFLTASDSDGHLEDAFAAGAVDYVTKPFRPAELLARIRNQLLLKYALDELRATKAELLNTLQDLEHLANTDPLTQVLNRRSWQDLAKREWQRAQRYGTPFAVLMLDCDRFKQVNDQYGHDVGDRVLCAIAGTLQTTCRELDAIARYGGEEFAILLPQTDAETARNLAERLCQAIAALAVVVPDGTVKVTASLGVGGYQDGDADLLDVSRRADRALYAAKEAGRNCVR